MMRGLRKARESTSQRGAVLKLGIEAERAVEPRNRGDKSTTGLSSRHERRAAHAQPAEARCERVEARLLRRQQDQAGGIRRSLNRRVPVDAVDIEAVPADAFGEMIG